MNYKEAFFNKGYGEKTSGILASWMNKLQKHYASKDINELTISEIRDYVDLLLTRRNLSPSSRIQAKKAYECYYNSIINKNYNFDEVVVPRNYTRIAPEYFSQEEILEIIASSLSLKARIIISIAYGCGLDVSELCNIKKSDIDFSNKTLKVVYSKPKKIRYAVLPNILIEDIKLYLEDSKPKKWLFENRDGKDKMAMRGAHWAFQKALEKSSIKKVLYFKALKYSYIKHLENNGFPLTSILDEINLKSPTTYYTFSIAGVKEKPITVSPLDYLQIKKNVVNFETQFLVNQLNKVNNEGEKEYLLEAIKCLDVGAYRAGIIFIWNYAIRNIQHRLLRHSINTLNQAIEKHSNNSKRVTTEDDFAFIKESIVLLVSVDLGEFDKNQKKILDDCLEIRNLCSHPGKYKPTETKAKSYVEDLLNILY
jgi:integrase